MLPSNTLAKEFQEFRRHLSSSTRSAISIAFTFKEGVTPNIVAIDEVESVTVDEEKRLDLVGEVNMKLGTIEIRYLITITKERFNWLSEEVPKYKSNTFLIRAMLRIIGNLISMKLPKREYNDMADLLYQREAANELLEILQDA